MAIGRMFLNAKARTALSVVVVLGSMTASYLAVSFWREYHRSNAIGVKEHTVTRGAPINPFASANGTHLVAFVITASDCGWSSQEATKKALGSVRSKLRSAHGVAYAQVSVIGVALDDDLSAGLQFLSDIGEGSPEGAFDQVIVGGSWLNEQVVRLVWREGIARASTPQVIVIERPVNTEDYLLKGTIAVQTDKVLVNPTGSSGIFQWLEQGVPLIANPGGPTAG